ncbi:MAG: hypothetical protein Kow00128_20650 [Deltaproteobacteria bacterium]
MLVFSRVTTEPDPAYDVPIWEVDFALRPGELLLVRLERGHFRVPLADAAVGLLEPLRGEVRFLGENWQAMPPERAEALRGKCGRVFAGAGWLRSRSVTENIILARLHHTARPEEEIEEEAANLVRYFGLPGLPLRNPGKTRRDDLGRAALARAFLGRPELILLEQPTRHLFPQVLPSLMNAVRAARKRGAAVVWITAEPRIWNDPALRADWKGTLFGSRMQLVRREE